MAGKFLATFLMMAFLTMPMAMPARAHDANAAALRALPLLAEASAPGGGFVLAHVRTDGAPVYAEIVAHDVASSTAPWITQPVVIRFGPAAVLRPTQIWGGAYGPNFTVVPGASAFVPLYGGEHGRDWAHAHRIGARIHVAGETFDEVLLESVERPAGSPYFGLALNIPGGRVHAGDAYLLLYFAGEARAWTYRIHGDEGATLVGLRTGPTFFRTEEDFVAPASAHVGADTLDAHAVVLGELTLHVAHDLVGAYTKPPCAAACTPAPWAGPGGPRTPYQEPHPTEALTVERERPDAAGEPADEACRWTGVAEACAEAREDLHACRGYPGCWFHLDGGATRDSCRARTGTVFALIPTCRISNEGRGAFTFRLHGAGAGLQDPDPGAGHVFLWGADVPLRETIGDPLPPQPPAPRPPQRGHAGIASYAWTIALAADQNVGRERCLAPAPNSTTSTGVGRACVPFEAPGLQNLTGRMLDIAAIAKADWPNGGHRASAEFLACIDADASGACDAHDPQDHCLDWTSLLTGEACRLYADPDARDPTVYVLPLAHTTLVATPDGVRHVPIPYAGGTVVVQPV